MAGEKEKEEDPVSLDKVVKDMERFNTPSRVRVLVGIKPEEYIYEGRATSLPGLLDATTEKLDARSEQGRSRDEESVHGSLRGDTLPRVFDRVWYQGDGEQPGIIDLRGTYVFVCADYAAGGIRREEIIVRGALFIDGEEDVALYATTADGTYMVKLNALWLGKIVNISTYTEAELRALDGQYVEVEGRVDANQRGPGDAYNCELEEVKKIQKVEPENTLPSQKPLPTMWVY